MTSRLCKASGCFGFIISKQFFVTISIKEETLKALVCSDQCRTALYNELWSKYT